MLRTTVSTILLILTAVSSAAGAEGLWNFATARVGQVFESETSSTCGGAVVGADLVLTAAHCVVTAESSDPVDPRSLTFSYTEESGQTKVFQVVDIATDPSFVRRDAPTRDQIARDVALLRLDRYLTGDVEVMAPLDSTQPYVALLPTQEEAPFEGEPCAAEYEDENIVILSCTRAKGSSGMPAFSLIDGERKIVAVVSANGNRKGEKITFGANPSQMLGALRWISERRPVPGSFD